MIKHIVLAALLASAASPASATNVAFQCKGEGFFNPYLDKADRSSVEYDKLQQKYAGDRLLTIVVKGDAVTVVGANYPGAMSMQIAQHGTQENGWSFVKVVNGQSSSPVHFLKINSFEGAGKTGQDGFTHYPFAYSMNGEVSFGTCIKQ